MEPRRSKLRDLALVTFTTVGWALPLGAALVMLTVAALRSLPGVEVAVGLCALSLAALAVVRGYRRVRERGPRAYSIAYDALVLAAMPLWGLAVNHSLNATCVHNTCDGDYDMHRAFAEPWVAAPLALHVATALGYALSRRRPERLRPAAEALVLALMAVGALLHLALGAQLGAKFLLVGLAVAPIGLPVVSPWLTVALHAGELRARLRRRGAEEDLRARDAQPEHVYRHAELPPDAPPPRVSTAWLARALALSPALMGAYAALAALAAGRPSAGVMAFTQTCDHALSSLPVRVVEGHCHYLCTVAAQGHPWLVRPERMGVRNGVPIVVNRQLAVANAFEDLLHARWPRFGRLCRRVYDRLGLPVSRYIRARWMADAVYLAMKPLEWGFYAALLLLDPGDPEGRVDRMYRG